jgi:hypothetical protein
VTAPLEVRSFRSVVAHERRIYRVDTLRLNPGGIPLRGVVYALVLVLVALAAAAVPPTDWLDGVIPWYVRDLAMPLAVATLFAAVRIEGRPFHLAAVALIGHRLAYRRLEALVPLPRRRNRWDPPSILCIPDGSDARFRALRYRGPGAVLVSHPHLRAEWSWPRRADVSLHPLAGASGRPIVLELAPGAVLEVRTS